MYVHICMYVCMYLCMYACVCACVYVCIMYACVYVCMYPNIMFILFYGFNLCNFYHYISWGNLISYILGTTQPPFQWVSGALSLKIKRPEREADHSTPSDVLIKNV